MKKEKPVIKYYPDPMDGMWNQEVQKLIPWISGKGADIGCGTRTINEEILRVDCDKAVNPDTLVKDYKLPYKENELDFVVGVHSFEHFPYPNKTLAEWLRVIKKGGIIGIVHPDIDFTKKQNPEIDNKGLRENPFNRHFFEHNQKSFMAYLQKLEDLPFRIIDTGVACGGWSFYFILKKT